MFIINGVEIEYTRGKFFKNIKVMPERSAFGEIALFQQCMRTASIKSLDHEIELAALTKDDFNKSLRAIHE